MDSQKDVRRTATSEFGSLRNVSEDDLADMLAWRNSPSVRSKMFTQHVIAWEEHVRWWNAVKDRKDQIHFIYEFQNEPLGVVIFKDVDTLNKSSSWAFYAKPDAPKGTGSRMELLALNFIFLEFGMEYLYCEVLSSNEAVVGLHQKFGFSIKERLAEQRIGAQIFDFVRLGIERREWLQRRDEVMARMLSAR
ncbi:UDP-4-amino-4,6-dideoxy-N-acetyl-beta-L-altrosamine N-acetyltransferase [Microvirga sp. TS319]|uniref:UDP-4-amino-4, 6-dideoxy-N-acetyl-beta-L-altrosamine N-acetyltransferase n=1 Tax=Microvirga sp. TS319 TaxID=3241165 RepID=UPI00351A9369